MQVWIVVDALENHDALASPLLAAAVMALQQAIAINRPEVAIRVVSAKSLQAEFTSTSPAPLLCPLTLNIAYEIPFWGTAVFQRCREVEELRSRVHSLGYSSGEGSIWLPLVLTARGLLYAEAIEPVSPSDSSAALPAYRHLHLADAWRQQVYQLGRKVITMLAAPPSTYWLQFGIGAEQVYFDRLLPFPGLPAIASLDVQTPDLFSCYWHCLTHQPIRDICLTAIEYRVLDK